MTFSNCILVNLPIIRFGRYFLSRNDFFIDSYIIHSIKKTLSKFNLRGVGEDGTEFLWVSFLKSSELLNYFLFS